MLVQKYNPSLSDLLNVDNLPSNLGFLQAPLSSFLGNFFYQNLQAFKRKDGATASYTLDIITYQQLVLLEIPGTGVQFVVNPPPPNTNIQGSSLFNVSFEYTWEILKYIRNANIQSFSFDLKGYMMLLSSVFGISQQDFLQQTVTIFITNSTNPADPLQVLVNNYNSTHTNQLSYTPGTTTLAMLLTQLLGFGEDILLFIVNNYLKNGFDDFKKLISTWVGPLTEDRLKDLLIPQFSASINNIGFGVTFPRSILIPLDNNGNQLPGQSMLYVSAGAFLYDSKRGFQFDEDISFSFTNSDILNTGFTLAINDAKIDLSQTYNIPEAVEDGRPSDFMGVYIKDATIGFPEFWNHDDPGSTGIINCHNLICGTGGISGTIALEAKVSGHPSPFIKAQFGSGFSLSLDTFSITLQQNSITASEIKGTMVIPGFKDGVGNDATITIDVHIGTDGSFDVTGSVAGGLTIHIPKVLDFTITSLEIGRTTKGQFFAALSGSLSLTANVPVLGDVLPKQVDIKKLIVYDDGTFEFQGGTVYLPKPASIAIGPVDISISAISMGTWENPAGRKYRYFGFDGGLDVDPGGVDVRASGVKFYYPLDLVNLLTDVFIRIEGIAIDIIIPGSASPDDAAVLLSGFLTMKNPPSSPPPPPPATSYATETEYVGGVSVTLPKAGISGSATIAYDPQKPAFLIDMDLELSTPIPLVPGLGIYGFRGLIGQRFVADITNPALNLPAGADWWQYYKDKVTPEFKEGIQGGKLEEEDGFSLGAGVSLATTGDSGKTFSSKIFFLLSLPDVFLLQGQAAILRQRIGLDTTSDPPFSLFVAITDQYVQAAFGVNYNVPEDSGNIATITGDAEMSFPFHNNSWYVNIGRDVPASKRISARIFQLFDAYFYFMINAQGIRAGAGASFNFTQNYGPVGVYLTAYLDVAGHISFEPKQIGGSIDAGGSVGVKVFFFKLGFSVALSLAGEAPHPFDVTGSVTISISLPWPFKSIGVTISLTWTFDSTLQTGPATLIDLTSPTAKQPSRGLNINTVDSFGLYYSLGSIINSPTDANWGPDASNGGRVLSQGGYTIPLDTFIDIESLKSMLPQNTATSNFGGFTMPANYVENIGPQQAASTVVQHQYFATDVKIFFWNGSSWQLYDVYGALTPEQDVPFINPADLTGLKSGFWQLSEPNVYNKLRVLGQTPFSYLTNQAGNPILPEDMGIFTSDIFCAGTAINATCINFDGQQGSTAGLPTFTAGSIVLYMNLYIRVSTHNGKVVAKSGFGHFDALQIQPGDTCEIFFTQPTVNACLYISSTPGVTIQTFQKVQSGFNSSNIRTYTYNLITSQFVTSAQLANPVCYQNPAIPIDKIVITAGQCQGEQGFTCSSLTPQANQFLIFLNVLVKDHDLTSPSFNLFPNKDSIYNHVYQNTVLYGATSTADILTYKATVTSTTLTVSITDNQGFSCGFTLQGTIPGAVVNFNGIVAFQNLRIDPNNTVNGVNYSFLVDAITAGGVITLKGTSCYPIATCTQDCNAYLFQICTLSLQDYLYNISIPSSSNVSADNTAMVNALNKTIQPIWRPNTIYTIQMTLQDNVYVPYPSLAGNNTTYFNVGFQTAGPIGFFHQNASGMILREEYKLLVENDTADQYKLADLKHYMDYQHSYPNADGNILSAKPLFYYNPQLLLFYLQNYVFEMFSGWNMYNGLPAISGNMQVTIKDPSGPSSQTAVGATVSFTIGAITTPTPTGTFFMFLSNGNHYALTNIDTTSNNPTIVASNVAAAISSQTPFTGSSIGPVVTITTPVGTAYNGITVIVSSPVFSINNSQGTFTGGLDEIPLVLVLSPSQNWVQNNAPKVSKDVEFIGNMIQNGGPCTAVSSISLIGVNTTIELPSLEPLKLYNAIFYNNFNGNLAEVLRYNFQTSQYKDFTDQVQSWILDPVNSVFAVFNYSKAFAPSDITSGQQIVDGTQSPTDPLISEFADVFDRLVDGALKLGAIDPAQTTDFTVIKDTNTSRVLGILVRNPEPFNDPKLPLTQLVQTLTLSLNGGSTNAFTVIFSKDRAKAFITNVLSGPTDSLNMGTGTLLFTFQYMQYSGTQYVVIDTETAQFNIS